MVKKVLIVDDESDVRYTVKHGLEGLDKGYQVVGVESGEKCFEVLENETLPDLIILDIMMPGMNGWEVHRRLKDHAVWREIPLLFMTAVEDQTSKRMIKMMSDGFVEKPVKIPELKQHIEKLLHQ